MKYLVTEMRAIAVDAETKEDAEAKGVALLDGGFGETYAVEVEPLQKEGQGE